MKFLIDSQLPCALARLLTDLGHQGVHVLDIGLAQENNRAIWAYAAQNGFVIVSKDVASRVSSAYPGEVKKVKTGQNDPEKEQQSATEGRHCGVVLEQAQALAERLYQMFPREQELTNRKWVGWDSNPQPTPKAFGAALPLSY